MGRVDLGVGVGVWEGGDGRAAWEFLKGRGRGGLVVMRWGG